MQALAVSEGEEELLPADQPAIRHCSRGTTLLSLTAVALGCVALLQLRPGQSLRSGEVRDTEILSEWLPAGQGWVDLGPGAACRANETDTSTQPDEGKGTILHDVASKEDCMAACADMKTCQGFEYWKSKDHCELWQEPVGWHVNLYFSSDVTKDDYHFICILRNPSCDEIKVHQKLNKEFIAKLNDYHDKKCPSPEKSGPHCGVAFAEKVLTAAKQLDAQVAKICQ